MRRHRDVTVTDKLNDGVILLIKAIKDIVVELLCMERLTNGGKDIREGLDFVEEDGDGGAQLFCLAQLGTKMRGASRGLRSKGAADDGPRPW